MHSVLIGVDDPALRAELTQALIALDRRPVVVDAFQKSPSGTDIAILAFDPAAPCVERIEALRAERIPVLLLVSSVSEDVLRVANPLHPAGYVLRPVALRELATAIDVAMFQANAPPHRMPSERWFQTTLRSIGDAVITADDNSLITFMNSAAEALTGWMEAEAMGRPLEEVFAVEGMIEGGNDPASMDSGQPVLRLFRRDGSSCVIEHSAAPIVEDTGALHGVVVVLRDITERRRIEQRLALTSRMTSVGTLAAGIAHELNNPLAFVTSNLDFAINELEEAERHGPAWPAVTESIAALREAADGATRAAQIVRDMRIFIRGDADPKTIVDVNRAVSFAVRLTSAEVKDQATLVTSLGKLPPIMADEGKLVQVFVNLLTNAAQAVATGQSMPRIEVRSEVAGDQVCVRIKDNGGGIANEHLARIFEPFFTTKPVGQGLGLGLPISHTIVSSFGGTIIVEKTDESGTTFLVSLPIDGGDAKSAHHKAQASAVVRILVVDDEPLIGTAVRRILAKQGFAVTVESDSRAAIDLIEHGATFDVILCDLMMPGFSGVDFYERLGEVAPHLQSRMIMMTGNAFAPRAHELFQRTQNVRVEKPFVPDDLLEAVAEVLRRHVVPPAH